MRRGRSETSEEKNTGSVYVTCRESRVILHKISFPGIEESFAEDRAALYS